ncbi:YciI family protein [Planomonospora alba]|uniref:YciI family protein n=1 Tax=Planomonospora alba TaxID=161354 RepID=A0ABP6NRD8_9ACTN
MKYALLIYRDEGGRAAATETEIEEARAAHGRFVDMLTARGAYLGGEGLDHSATAVTVRTGGGRALRTDGPCAETTGHLSGLHLVEARDLDEAIEFAAACPEEIVEIRPVVEYQG